MPRASKAIGIGYTVVLGVLLLTDLPFRVAAMWPELLRNREVIAPLVHLVAFSGLGWIMLKSRGTKARWAIAAGLVAAAAGTEILQGLVPHRVADPTDFLWNVGGIALAAALTWPRNGRETGRKDTIPMAPSMDGAQLASERPRRKAA